MSLRILSLEDNSADAELNEAMLCARWPECQVIRVETRDAFIEALKRADFDLILSDFSIPGFDGQSALALAHEQCPHIPFLFVSGTIGEERAIEAMKGGATDYVLKHRTDRLLPAVERALREVRDRQDRERAEAAMRESEHKYRQLFECLSDAAFLAEAKNGKIIDTNRRATELTGRRREDIVGHKLPEFIGSDGATNHLVHANGSKVPVGVRDSQLTLYNRALVLKLCHEWKARK